MNSVIEQHACCRSMESGKTVCQWNGIDVINHTSTVTDFRDLEIGTCFKMIAGKWLMKKVSEAGAIRCRGAKPTEHGYSVSDFEGWERCYVVSDQEDECTLSLPC